MWQFVRYVSKAGWAEKKAYPKVTDPEDGSAVIEKAMLERREATTTFTEWSLPLLSHLWPDEEREGERGSTLPSGRFGRQQAVAAACCADDVPRPGGVLLEGLACASGGRHNLKQH